MPPLLSLRMETPNLKPSSPKRKEKEVEEGWEEGEGTMRQTQAPSGSTQLRESQELSPANGKRGC